MPVYLCRWPNGDWLAKAEKLVPPAGFELLDERSYGATRVLFLAAAE